MTAHVLTQLVSKPGQVAQVCDTAIAAEIGQCISLLFDAKARQRITDAYRAGWITAEDALETMLSLDLVEVSDG